MPRLAF